MDINDVLEAVAWGEEHFGSVVAGGPLKKRDIERAVKKGLVESTGPVAVCDADGFTLQPERYRTGYVLTEEGRKALARMHTLED